MLPTIAGMTDVCKVPLANFKVLMEMQDLIFKEMREILKMF
jgi:hypothetical protein